MNQRFLLFLSILIASSGTASGAGRSGLPPGSTPPRAIVEKAGPLDLKIDPALRYTLRRVEDLGLTRKGRQRSPQQVSAAKELPSVLDLSDERQVLVPVFVKTASPESVRSLVRTLDGASSTFAGGYLTARVPPDKVADLASSPFVETVHGVSPLSPELDLSRVDMKADAVQAGTGLPGPLTGKGVVVGIYDSGVDFNHSDFKTSEGKTRILFYWDTTRSGNPPAGFSVGWECSAADIDSGSCSSKDTSGHGTHVAGIAAGNGRSASGTYTGIAPDADIIVVKFGGVSSTEAVDYIFRKAASLGRPAVINMSLGSQSGDHDGTDPDEIGISALLGPGRIFVKSAGNDGDSLKHVTHTIKGTDYQSGLSTGLYLRSASGSVWGVGNLVGATFGVAVLNDSSFSLIASLEAKAGLRLERTPLKNGSGETVGFVTIDASQASSKGRVFYAIDEALPGLLWDIFTYGGGQMDAWATNGTFSGVGKAPGDTRTTLTIPGTARRVLTVGSHITKTSWTDVDGNPRGSATFCSSTPDVVLGGISCFSSRGPTWDGRTKPDVTAPGMFIASALSGSLDQNDAELRKQIVSGGGYQISQGTSMAAPHVTGLVALMLQARPTLDDAGALAALKLTAVKDSSTGTDPDPNTWGAGKVNALEAVKAVTGAGGSTTLFVPVILKSSGANNSFYTSEMTLTNRGSANADITFSYTATAGGGSGSGTATLAAGRQLIVPDAIDYLRAQGVPIPDSGNRVGTLRVQFSGVSANDVGVLVRTTTPVPTDAPTGAAGLAYAGIPPSKLPSGPVLLCGLRRDALDRTNIAVQNAGDESQGTITVRIEVLSGERPAGAGVVVFSEDVTLAPGGFRQVTPPEFASGYARVSRTSGSAPYYAYAVINDNFNSDGSFVLPVEEASLGGTSGLTLPVALEASVFSTEAVIANLSAEEKGVSLEFYADPLGASPAKLNLLLAAGQQLAFTNIIEEMRREGFSIPTGVVGPIFVTAPGGSTKGIFVGARTGSPGGGGRYSLFYSAVPFGAASTSTAWINGLQQTGTSRSNVAIVNTGEVDGSDIFYSIEIFDGDDPTRYVLMSGRVAAKRFLQISAILGQAGMTNAYARVTRTSGTNPFVTYGVINDGGIPGARSGDGAFVLSE